MLLNCDKTTLAHASVCTALTLYTPNLHWHHRSTEALPSADFCKHYTNMDVFLQTGPACHRSGKGYSVPGRGRRGREGRRAAGRRPAGAWLDHHHLIQDESTMTAAELHWRRPSVGGAAAASVRTGHGAEPGPEGSGAPAALVLQQHGLRWGASCSRTELSPGKHEMTGEMTRTQCLLPCRFWHLNLLL